MGFPLILIQIWFTPKSANLQSTALGSAIINFRFQFSEDLIDLVPNTSYVLLSWSYNREYHISETRWEFASNCSIFKLPDSRVEISKLKIFDMWPISLDHVIYHTPTQFDCWILRVQILFSEVMFNIIMIFLFLFSMHRKPFQHSVLGKQLNESSNDRYSFVCNALLRICNTTNLEQ